MTWYLLRNICALQVIDYDYPFGIFKLFFAIVQIIVLNFLHNWYNIDVI